MKNGAKYSLKIFFPFFALGLCLILGSGCPSKVLPPAYVEMEKVLSYTGEIKVILPDKEVIRLRYNDPLPEIPPGTTVEVERGRMTGLFAGLKVELNEGRRARLVVPALAVERLVCFTGRLKVILPASEEVTVEPGQILPTLPLGTRIVVLSGEMTVAIEGRSVELQTGQAARVAGVGEIKLEAERIK